MFSSPSLFHVIKVSDLKMRLFMIAALNGKDFKGRTLTLNEARPRADKPKTGGGKRF